MREILFRGKRVDNGEWVYGDLIHHDGYVAIWDKNASYVEDFEVIPETVGQYTGLKDKNGNKIFEGDIHEFGRNREGKIFRYVVKFGEFYDYEYEYYCLGWYCILLNDRCYCLAGNENEYMNIIGNIYDNFELLEVEK